MRSQQNHGVLYVATGERYVREAAESLRSLWRHHPSMPVTVYIDEPSRDVARGWQVQDAPRKDLLEIVEHPSPTYSWADKPTALSDRGSGERILFLDTDTRICGTVTELFEILDAFDLAAAHAPVRVGRQPSALANRAPAAFPELNTGVIAYRRTATIRRFLDRWRELHAVALGDQATFRVALYESDVRFTVLPPEYNCRFTFPTYLHGPVRILHGRGADLEEVERAVNGARGARVFVPGVGVLPSSPPGARI
jgi:hypothetical protein